MPENPKDRKGPDAKGAKYAQGFSVYRKDSRGNARERLGEYDQKRDRQATPEPFFEATGGSGLAVGGLFVVQKHAARRLHYDLRLELDGVLLSWAVPRGPSLDPADKRFAVQTEDHPFEYGDFEGVIPEGSYGAGAMIVWDRGIWVPVEEPFAGMESGKLLFELRGYKLRGLWTLFRLKPPAIHRGKDKNEDRNWMLMKKPDHASQKNPEDAPDVHGLAEESVLSGLTVEELAGGKEQIEALKAQLEPQNVPQLGKDNKLDLTKLDLMLAQPGDTPHSREDWIYELKYDGYRLLAAVREQQPFLRYRHGLDATHLFPEIARALSSHPADSMVLDGEVVVLRDDGRPSFNGLQQRAMLSRALDIERAALENPATLFVFDLLELCGYDLRALPLLERKRLLQELLPTVGPVRYLDHIPGMGKEFFAQIEKMGLEGMVAKKADSPWVSRRSEDWIKYRVDRTADFVIVGFTAPKGNRSGFGALHLAAWSDQQDSVEGEGLVYAGRVGTGFNTAQLEALHETLKARERKTPPCRGDVPTQPQHHWVEPELVCEVRYKEWTGAGLLRHPVFLRMREDKPIYECTFDALGEHGPGRETAPPEPASSTASQPVDGKTDQTQTFEPAPKLRFTNLDKIFYPELGLTKGDLIEYYRRVAPGMLRYLEERPIVLTRYPDGIHGKSFFQKNAPDFAPDWIRTETVYSRGSERDIEYFVCNDQDSLLYLANLGALVLHVWSSRMSTLAKPDWCILDLDPKDAPFADVVTVALEIRKLCEEIGMPSYVKTSGSSGLHVLLPLGQQINYEQSRALGQLIGTVICARQPEIATIVRNPAKREGKVYVDYVQNGHGRLLVAPFSARPKASSSVSTPLFWDEVNQDLSIDQHTLTSVPERLEGLDEDPLAPVLEDTPDLLAVLTALQEAAG